MLDGKDSHENAQNTQNLAAVLLGGKGLPTNLTNLHEYFAADVVSFIFFDKLKRKMKRHAGCSNATSWTLKYIKEFALLGANC